MIPLYGRRTKVQGRSRDFRACCTNVQQGRMERTGPKRLPLQALKALVDKLLPAGKGESHRLGL